MPDHSTSTSTSAASDAPKVRDFACFDNTSAQAQGNERQADPSGSPASGGSGDTINHFSNDSSLNMKSWYYCEEPDSM
ncbi:hypothetical protein L486_07116 [Kwoniella mangroviensis CBS 10435]|uniref:Uncharacterized protein n=1 Tax=Kwoniella mangroviensis CBS 10435 TaxID=1331196 RepID=A0A1B9IJR8_9TREE|nr:uncharacterized protein I203_07635 [Kwoniella mangroviensis CBS 8507]OCF55631.1 hypothetical protein L486_07116 [Kwoniella mangroviensis CBS 10435]OCF63211.1 hypothetical protein I203_07635 [Kwoniella mangroviensis CBS 8507]OCF73636.1 hypothetical protein I204_05479 [Kwoniella mangroviensis CBS 8886]